MLIQKRSVGSMPHDLGIKINVDENQIGFIMSNKAIVRDMIMNEEDNVVKLVETQIDEMGFKVKKWCLNNHFFL